MVCSPIARCTFGIRNILEFQRMRMLSSLRQINSSNILVINDTRSNNYTSNISYSYGIGNPQWYNDDKEELAVEGNLHLFETYFICGFSNLVMLLGLIGNLINIIVLTGRGISKNSTNYILLALSVSDLLVVLTAGIINSSCFVCYFGEAAAMLSEALINIYAHLANRSFSILSLDLVMFISVQRFVAIFFPLKVTRIFTLQCTKAIIAILYVFTFAWTALILSAIRPVWRYDQERRETIAYTFTITWNFKFYANFVNCSENIHIFTDVFLIFLTGSATIVRLIHHARRRTSLMVAKEPTAMTLAAVQRPQRKAIKMLLTICSISFFVYFSLVTFNIYTTINKYRAGSDHMYCFQRYLKQGILLMNSSINIIIYMTMSSQFWGNCKKFFGKRRRSKRNGSLYSTRASQSSTSRVMRK